MKPVTNEPARRVPVGSNPANAPNVSPRQRARGILVAGTSELFLVPHHVEKIIGGETRLLRETECPPVSELSV
ncbi:MAG: hypothetical protein FJ392_08160 [Verrucomicrobia bacterium]|nr:hypothetical protein [Verrucomicrobiota bacterium]